MIKSGQMGIKETIQKLQEEENNEKNNQRERDLRNREELRNLLNRLQVREMLEDVKDNFWKIGTVSLNDRSLKTIVGNVDTFYALEAKWLQYDPAHTETYCEGSDCIEVTRNCPDAIIVNSRTLLVGARTANEDGFSFRDTWRNGLKQVTVNDGTNPGWINSYYTILGGLKVLSEYKIDTFGYERFVDDENECHSSLEKCIANILRDTSRLLPFQEREKCLPDVFWAMRRGIVVPQGYEHLVS